MESIIKRQIPDISGAALHKEDYYRSLQKKHIIRLLLSYLAPLIVLTIYFYFQYQDLFEESQRTNLISVAENQAKTMDLFLRERIVNLSNIIDDPKFVIPPTSTVMENFLNKLQSNSETFVDVGFFDSTGVQVAYVGPFPKLEEKNYSQETWFVQLKEQSKPYIITDIYLGFRQKPHFTIAVSRFINDNYVVLRATLDPERIYEYITSLEGPSYAVTCIVNQNGQYQLAPPKMGKVLNHAPILPKQEPRLGVDKIKINRSNVLFAYSWLNTSNWVLIVRQISSSGGRLFPNIQINIIAFAVAIILLLFSLIVFRARKIVHQIRETDKTKAQLSDNLIHASKLAAVGELASGIAHEINNPLAIINEEVGLVKDMLNPEFGKTISREDILPQLDSVQKAVFRCRDITRKLLTFVRKTEVNMKPCAIHKVIDEVEKEFYERELSVSNIKIVRDYCQLNPVIIADRNQLQQVFVNLINNAIDAISNSGKIFIKTICEDKHVKIEVEDTGKGMTQEQLDKIFMPFYSTKEVGKGTGLGLSISYGIIKSLGGEISVESSQGKGTIFFIKLPLHNQ